MTTIYQVVTLGGVIKGTFVFLDDAKAFIETQEPLCHIIPLTVETTKTTKRKKDAGEKL